MHYDLLKLLIACQVAVVEHEADGSMGCNEALLKRLKEATKLAQELDNV